jgi:hypothetical protein
MKINRGKDWSLWDSEFRPTPNMNDLKQKLIHFPYKLTLLGAVNRANGYIKAKVSNPRHLYFIKTKNDQVTVTKILSYKDAVRIIKLTEL